MAIGTAAAIGIGLAGVGSAIGAKSQSKAASKAADTTQAVAQQNNALAKDIYSQNKTALSPFMQRGNAAGDQINALLGLGGAPANNNQPAQQQTAPTSYYSGANPGANPWAGTLPQGNALGAYGMRMNDGMAPGFNTGGNLQDRMWTQNQQPGQQLNTPQPMQNTAVPAQTAPGQTAQQAAGNAFDVFRNSTGYQFRLGEGMDAVNSGYAGAGTLQSGAALRAINEYGQNFASNEFGNYMNALGNQQGVGLSGASALAGVGQNYANNVQFNNSQAGDAAANAALIKGANNPFASVFGTVGGGLLGSR